jgi:general stress protein 26
MASEAITWDDLREQLTGLVHVATSTPDGRPHVAVVMTGVEGDVIWFLTRTSSGKAANLRANPRIAMMWRPGPEAYVSGEAEVIDDVDTKRRVWNGGILPYDPAEFFGTPEDPGVVAVRVRPVSATSMVADGGTIRRRRWRA